MRTLIVVTLAASTFLAGCMKSDASVVDQLSALIKATDRQPIDLAAVGPSSWTRVCVLTPYTNNPRAGQILGFSWNAELNTSIYTSDSINVLVFVSDKEVVAFAEYPRNLGDFSKFSPRCLPRADAKVVRQGETADWTYLVPAP